MLLPLLLEKIALVGAMVHTMEPNSTPSLASVILDRDRIVAVVPPEDPALQGLKTIDISGQHLVPGLIDAMVNFDSDHDRLYLSHGVTLVRDLGADLTHMIAERDAMARDRSPGPSLWIAGAVLDGPKPATRSAIVLASREEAVDKLSRLLDLGTIDFFSIHVGLPEDAWRATIEFAHRQQRPRQVWGPLPSGISLDQALEAGQDGLFHLDALLPKGKTWDSVRDEDFQATIERLARSELRITPTLAAYAQRLVPPRKDLPELAYLGPITVTQWMADALQREQAFTKDAGLLQRGAAAFARQSALVGRLHAAGVRLVPGSAAGQMPWMLPGEALVNELKLWVRAGIPAEAVLRAATEGSARQLGFAILEHGTIQAGKIANLVVLAQDPRQDLSSFAQPQAVIVRGRVVDKRELAELRESLSARQKELQKLSFAPLELRSPSLRAGELVLSGLLETRFVGQRIRGERYAVVRASDGGLWYSSRSLSFGTASTADSEVVLDQKILDGQLVELRMEVRSGPRVVELEGTYAAGMLNLQQRLNGVFQKSIRIRERVLFLDTGSALSDLIVGQHGKPGVFKALFLEDFEPARGDFHLSLLKDGDRGLESPLGKRIIRFGSDGSVQQILRQQGNGLIETKSLGVEVSGESAARLANPLVQPK